MALLVGPSSCAPERLLTIALDRENCLLPGPTHPNDRLLKCRADLYSQKPITSVSAASRANSPSLSSRCSALTVKPSYRTCCGLNHLGSALPIQSQSGPGERPAKKRTGGRTPPTSAGSDADWEEASVLYKMSGKISPVRVHLARSVQSLPRALFEEVDLCGVWGEDEGLAGSGVDALAEHGREVLAGEPRHHLGL